MVLCILYTFQYNSLFPFNILPQRSSPGSATRVISLKKQLPRTVVQMFPFYLTILLLVNIQAIYSLLHASLGTHVRISLAERWQYWFLRVYVFNILMDAAKLPSKKDFANLTPTTHIFSHSPSLFFITKLFYFGSSGVGGMVSFSLLMSFLYVY